MFAIVGMAGNVILFVCVGLLFVLMAAYFVALAARAYLVTAQATAAGLDEVEWPDEPVYDWLRQSTYLLFLLFVWIMPAGFLARGLADVWLPDDGPLCFTILIGLAVWLLFPVGLLAWQRADALLRLLACFPYLIGFYLLTSVLFAGCLGLLYVGLFTVGWWAVPLAAVFGPAGLLIHARLLGRLGWLIGQGDQAPKKKKKKRKRPRAEVTDPAQAPEEMRSHGAREIEEPKKPRPSYEEEPPDPYTLVDVDEQVTSPQPAQAEMRKEEIEREVALRCRQESAPPASVLFTGVWEYPFYATSRKAMAELGCWSVVVLWLARVLVTLYPG